MADNETLTYDELIEIFIALNNEADRVNDKEAEMLRFLKWKVFRLSVDAKREEAKEEVKEEVYYTEPHSCTNGGTEDWCDDCNPYLQ